MKTQPFDIATILTISSGKLLAPMEHVYAILNWMTGEDLFAHQLPRAIKTCQPFLLQQYPQLTEADMSALNAIRAHDSTNAERTEAVEKCVMANAARFGVMLDVAPLPMRDEPAPDPVAEAVEVFGADRVIVVESKGIAR